MTRHSKGFSVWLLSAPADAIAATLERFGLVRSDAGGLCLPGEPLLHVDVRFRYADDQVRVGGGLSISEMLMDMDMSSVQPEERQLARCCGISAGEAGQLMLRASAWIVAYSEDRASATSVLPWLVQTILAAHDGVGWDGFGSWSSEDVRHGQVAGMDRWPFPSVEEEFRRSDAVFVGKMTPMSWGGPEERGAQWLHVTEVLRGAVPRTVGVVGDGGMAPGKTYLLFAKGAGPRFEVDWEGNSGGLPEAAGVLDEARRLAAAARVN